MTRLEKERHLTYGNENFSPDQVRFFSEIERAAARIIRTTFPEFAREYEASTPTMQKYEEYCVQAGTTFLNEDFTGGFDSFFVDHERTALILYDRIRGGELSKPISITIILRQLDDFIDTVLWQHIGEVVAGFYDEEEASHGQVVIALRHRTQYLIERMFAQMQKIEPNVPKRLVAIFYNEIELAFSPDQTTFDNTIPSLIENKSFDLMYLASRIHEVDYRTIQPEIYQSNTLHDFNRDFNPADYLNATDCNIYRFIQEHHLRPTKLIQYLVEQCIKIDPSFSLEYFSSWSVKLESFGVYLPRISSNHVSVSSSDRRLVSSLLDTIAKLMELNNL